MMLTREERGEESNTRKAIPSPLCVRRAAPLLFVLERARNKRCPDTSGRDSRPELESMKATITQQVVTWIERSVSSFRLFQLFRSFCRFGLFSMTFKVDTIDAPIVTFSLRHAFLLERSVARRATALSSFSYFSFSKVLLSNRIDAAITVDSIVHQLFWLVRLRSTSSERKRLASGKWTGFVLFKSIDHRWTFQRSWSLIWLWAGRKVETKLTDEKVFTNKLQVWMNALCWWWDWVMSK